MYIPKHFRNENPEDIKKFLKENSFGILVSNVDGKLWATHIPLLLDKNEKGEDVLYGHISKANPQWKNFSEASQILAIFNGPHTYISSSWYDHENVPTWNYLAVHVYGKINLIDGDKLFISMKKLVDKYESGSKRPVALEKMSEDYVKKAMMGIVGFEIIIEDIQATCKLSQNRDEKNYNNIISELEARGDNQSIAIAEEMKKRR